MQNLASGIQYYITSFFIKHFYQVVQVLSVTFVVQPFLKITLKSTVQVTFHFATQCTFCY